MALAAGTTGRLCCCNIVMAIHKVARRSRQLQRHLRGRERLHRCGAGLLGWEMSAGVRLGF